jgi:hypothetical protein
MIMAYYKKMRTRDSCGNSQRARIRLTTSKKKVPKKEILGRVVVRINGQPVIRSARLLKKAGYEALADA